MIVDASALLAVVFEESHAAWAAGHMAAAAGRLRMSTVNLVEALIKARGRKKVEALEAKLRTCEIRFVAPDERQARIAAEARLKYPINLGDCFAYALAVVEGCPILAVDGDFESTGHPVILPPPRAG